MPTEIVRTVCNRDCPDACGLLATVEEGRVTRLAGDPDHPVTKGFLCYRTSRFPDRHYSPERLTAPLVRTPDGFVPISWEEAIDLAASRLLKIRQESGPAAILHYRSGGSLGLLKSVVDYFFELLGPVSVKRGDICSGAGDAAQETDFGEEESHDLFDLKNARSILLWGKNPNVSNVHLLPILRDAKKRGTRIILIDPIRHKAAAMADHVILPMPGGDFALAMGVARRLLETGGTDPEAASYCDNYEAFTSLARTQDLDSWAEEAGVAPADVDILATALSERPCNIQVGWGMARRVNGSSIVRALDALGAISGNLGIPGGGVSFYFKRRGAFDTSFLKKEWPRTLVEPRLGHEMLAASDPPVRAVWVTAGNPVAMLPDSAVVAEAFETREFVVTVDSFMTDTARRSHLILPTTTLLEDDDLLGAYGNHWIGASVPAVAAPPGVRSDLEIVQLLAQAIDARTGANGNGIHARVSGTAREWKERLLKKVEPMGVTVDLLEKKSVRNPLAPDLLFADRKFPTPTGRVQLVHQRPPVPEDEPGFPLWLFSNSTENSQSSQWAGPVPAVLTATVNAEAVPEFEEGEEIWIESALGRIRGRLRFDPLQRPDVVLVPKGGHYDNGTCANALVRARTTDAGEGAAYQDCKVRITR